MHLTFQPSPSSEGMLKLIQAGFVLLLQPSGKCDGEYLWVYLNEPANERQTLST